MKIASTTKSAQGISLPFDRPGRGPAQGILVHNHQQEIIFYNEDAAAITGLTQEQIADNAWLEANWPAFFEDNTPFTAHKFSPALAFHTRLPQRDMLLRIASANGTSKWINFSSTPVIDPASGNISICVTTIADLSAQRSLEKDKKQQEEKWRSVLNTSGSAIFLMNTDYFITLVNEYGKGMLKIMGDSEEINESSSFLDKLPESRREPVKKILDRVLAGERVEYEIMYTLANGEDLWLYVDHSPVKDEKGNTSAICVTANNITALKIKEIELQKKEQRWKFALDGAGDGVWEYNFQTSEAYYSTVYKTMLGFSENEFANEDYEWRKRLHPDDLERINDIDKQYETGAIDHHSIEYRIMTKSGEYAWVLDRGMLLERLPDGRPLKLIGTHKNITESKMEEERLTKSEQRFSSFMANTPTMTWIIDEHAVFRFLNEPYMKAFQLSTDDIGRSIYEIFPPAICKGFIENNWIVWQQERSIETIEEGVGPSGEQQFYHIFKFPLKPENGVRLLGGVALDITNKIQIEQQLAAEEQKKKREIIQAIIDAQEKERKELAYELHDNVNQVLTSSKLMLEVASERPELSAEFVRRSLNYLNIAIVEIRKISHSLTPGTLEDISLEVAIDEVVQSINTTGKLAINYRKTSSRQKDIQPEIRLSALRIAQEQLNNILKHSSATEAVVTLDLAERRLFLSISDNGTGFDPATVKKGLGLNNIFNRVEYYHGRIQLDSAPGKGCLLSIEIPLA